jgi:putative Holliday junction resolvase
MGIDWGERRIGVAVSDELGLTCQGVAVVHRHKDGKDLAELAALVKEWNVDRVIVGVPIRDDGTAGPTTPKAIAFAELLRGRFAPIPVETWDESNTSIEANRILKARGVNWKDAKKDVDRIAAAVMLQSWLDERAPSAPGGEDPFE